jgi:hypothetical protein
VGLFRRKGRHGPSRQDRFEEPDELFRYLSVHQAARIRALAHQAFAEQGLEVTVRPGYVQTSDGRQFGLSNLAAACHHHPGGERAWPRTVRGHVGRILRAMESAVDPTQMSVDDLREKAFIRLVGTSNLPGLDNFQYHRPIAGDLVELLALDSPESVTLLSDEVVSGHDLADLRMAGVTNLLCEPFGRHEWIDVSAGSGFCLVAGDSVYTASRLLTMTDVLNRALRSPEPPAGLIVCAPNRHQLAFHPIVDRGVLPALHELAGFAARNHADGVGPVSPFVYWLQAGQWQQLSFANGERNLRIEIDDRFGAVLQSLPHERHRPGR